ncbi:MAG: terminase small subunit [Proteobacteria bacterium]|nr:terminase small subunit [Pseudomonadota bacterium]
MNGKAPAESAYDYKLFCNELICNGLNAKAAYLKVHPDVTSQTAEVNGHRMVRIAKVQAILTPMLQKLFQKAGIEADYVFKGWLEMSQASP